MHWNIRLTPVICSISGESIRQNELAPVNSPIRRKALHATAYEREQKSISSRKTGLTSLTPSRSCCRFARNIARASRFSMARYCVWTLSYSSMKNTGRPRSGSVCKHGCLRTRVGTLTSTTSWDSARHIIIVFFLRAIINPVGDPCASFVRIPSLTQKKKDIP
jgi:hypothetical protein